VSAIGRPGMVDASYVKPGAFVIDVGTTPRDGVVLGDVDRQSVEPVAGWLTPVPGGVGPMTIAMLLRNVLALARARRALARV
jgi:methylenetetrahydrofolate dehydrogenase (NADP+)/methenyltetrahydrofolate cyclohydrolase